MPEEKKLTPAAPTSAPDSNKDALIDAVLAGRCADPFAVLGPHPIWSPLGHGWAIRFFRPGAADAMGKQSPDGRAESG